MNKKILIAFTIMGILIGAFGTALFFTHLENNRLRASLAETRQTAPETEYPKSDPAQNTASLQERNPPASPAAPSEQEAENSPAEKAEDKAPEKGGSITSAPAVESGYSLAYSVNGSWEDGSTKMNTVQMTVSNNSPDALNGWTLIVVLDRPVSVEGWNGVFSVEDDRLTVSNADFNKDIPAGGSAEFGCNLGTGTALNIRSATLNGTPCAISPAGSDGPRQPDSGTGRTQAKQPSSDSTPKPGKGTDTQTTQSGLRPSDASAAESPAPRTKAAKQGDDWLHTDGSRILDKDGREVWITGVNWFGYNTGTNTFDGLWNSRLEPTVKAIADHGFNLIRVPMSAELINQWAAGIYPEANYNRAYNEKLTSMNSLEIFDYFLTLAEENGLKVMPDIHSAETNAAGHTANLWYTDRISAEDYFHALEWMAQRYRDNDTIIAYDLKNEPHGKPNEGKNAAIWNDSKAANNWKYVAETAAARVLDKNPNVLILVEGTEIYPRNGKGDYSSANSGDYYFNWWGGNLRAVADYPLDLGKYQDKLVYSPHDYGPTVYMQPWFSGNYTYESLMRDCWHDNWFFIHEQNIAPLLIGEWGGFMREPNLTWMTHMRRLIGEYRLNHTFWCLNANSGDTGGLLLDDFTTWDEEKYNFVREVLWQENGRFVGLDHEIPLGVNGISL